ncbi:zinc finger protein [Macleaya cordata]|uniref:Zinc finger protein n=1 Tax=Macleaya cordata TaxID=56857 RepID=A0A200PUY1_MACCD|nr:zinc finger protein [Macleaya cordata]
MPRARDIGWQHGKMIAGHRHHVQCNYCHRIMIGGVTRFKKHLASRRGEIRGCEAVPKEVRELIEKHLVAWETRKTTEKKRKKVYAETLNDRSYDEKDTESDESDRETAGARLESLRTLHEAEEAHQALTNATDLGWVHGMMVNGDQQKIKCRYCHKVILGGGISRLKQHLAGERGNIAPCDKVPEDVKAQMQQHLGFKVLERLKKQKESDVKVPLISCSQGREEGSNDDVQRSPMILSSVTNSGRSGKEWDEGTSGRRKRQKKQVIPIDTPVTQPPLQHLTFASQESVDQADMAVAKFMYDAGIPFSAANSLYFQQMADAIAAVGPGYKMPSYHSLRGDLLNRSAQELGDLCQELRKSWEVTGCSVMADKWTYRTGCTVLNFFVYCSKGTIFLKSVDASEISKYSEALLNLFDSIVQEVGPKNIVHFITDTTPNYKAAGKMLMDKYKTFFWSACGAHCIDLMLEELGKMDEVKEGLTKAKKVCQFIYNHAWVLNLMKKKTNGRDIVRPSLTRFATNFLTLQSIVSFKDPLHQMFTSTTWMQSALSKQRAGLEITETLLDPLFWSQCAQILKVTEPLLAVLHLAGSEERPCMGYLFDAMDKAKKGIIDAFDNKETNYLPYLKVIDRIWEEDLHSPLHAAAHYLNPSVFYNPSFSTNKVIQKGLLDCIEGLEPNLTAQDMITRQITFYEDAVGDFSRPVAIRGRVSLAPVGN